MIRYFWHYTSDAEKRSQGFVLKGSESLMTSDVRELVSTFAISLVLHYLKDLSLLECFFVHAA